MARVKAALNFSTADALSYAINLSKSFSGLVDSGHVIKTKVLGVAQGSDAVTIAKANDKTDVAYVYLCNLGASKRRIYLRLHRQHQHPQAWLVVSSHLSLLCPDIDLKVYGTSWSDD